MGGNATLGFSSHPHVGQEEAGERSALRWASCSPAKAAEQAPVDSSLCPRNSSLTPF